MFLKRNDVYKLKIALVQCILIWRYASGQRGKSIESSLVLNQEEIPKSSKNSYENIKLLFEEEG
jgi:hypothetical protein